MLWSLNPMKPIIFIVLQLAASGSDAYFTNRNAMLSRFREHNPISRPFMANEETRIGYFSIDAALKITIPMIVRRKHPHLARGIAIGEILDNAQGAIFSATH
jgi:hypothetical protein